MGNTYSSFLSPKATTTQGSFLGGSTQKCSSRGLAESTISSGSSLVNPRQQVLENFKEISRIMTQNFLTHKKLEKKYANSSLPK